MGEIKWIETISCKECVGELNKAGKEQTEQIMQDRAKRQKCRGCERLEVGNEQTN